MAFVRLKAPQVLETSLETSAPVRFIFVLIGPANSDVDYLQTRRAMAALLTDNVKIISRDWPVEPGQPFCFFSSPYFLFIYNV